MNRIATDAGGPRVRRPASSPPDDANTLRMLALMGGHERFGWRPALFAYAAPSRHPRPYPERAPESDRAYFRRRSQEERRAAQSAAGVEAREAHEALADLYAGLSAPATDRRERSSRRRGVAVRPAPASRRKRQDALLDEALKGTFPASDPLSVAFVR